MRELRLLEMALPKTRFNIFILVVTFVVILTTNSYGAQNEASIRILSPNELEKAKQAAHNYVDRLTKLENNAPAQGRSVKEGCPMSTVAKLKQPSEEVIAMSRKNMKFLETVRILKNEFGFKDEEVEKMLWDRQLDGCLPNRYCLVPSTYRAIDGGCNHRDNLQNLGRGASGYRRFLLPAYDDGISTPRSHGITGNDLPSPQLISMNIFNNQDKPLSNITSLLMQFGQFIGHDMANTYLNFQDGDELRLKMRSSTGPNRISCNLSFVSYAEQTNQNTHWLDASTVYGSYEYFTYFIKNVSNGMLNMKTDSYGHQLLPTSPYNSLFSNAGDSRVEQQPQLTVIHTIWMREHNRIAKKLIELNPDWSSETVFQETRRIVIAELQHITYNEFLPTLFGKGGMAENRHLWSLPGKNTFNVETSPQGGMFVYKNITDKFWLENVKSGPVSNEFAAAAFRMGHSLVQGKVQLIDKNGTATFYNMASVFNRPYLLSNPHLLDNFIRGLVNQPSQTVDNQIADDMRLRLFNISGMDIVAINIHRGRDHGLPSYNNYREKCGLPKLKKEFTSIPTKKPTSSNVNIPYFDRLIVKKLSMIYKSVDDIDLFVGGLLEINPLDDSLLGPTFMCIIADNFLRLKYEDRYFYEAGVGTNPNPFTPEQLTEIKKSSMARILCDNNDGTVSTIQPNAFVVPSQKNPIVNCKGDERIPNLNLDNWQTCFCSEN